jgi:ubiquinone/menaquinone biosynthesis C-methylase UbiE
MNTAAANRTGMPADATAAEVEPAAASLGDIGAGLHRLLYKLQQRSLALSMSVGVVLWHAFLNGERRQPSRETLALLERRYGELLDQDLANVARGYYPRALLHDFPLVEYLTRLPEAILDMPRVAWRRYQGRYDDLPAEAASEDYPPYYRRAFHWQTDGWLSDRSARLYDAGVEFLFGGTADVMRRMAVPAIVEGSSGTNRPRILDVGCGTGRFLRSLHRALPHARLYGLDLSPYYLRRARSVLAAVPDVRLVTENAQDMPFADGWFDVVCSVFLFHELPAGVRRDVMREMRRVLKPGGRIVICDSAQFSDSPELRTVLGNFPRTYHEPYYNGYLADDLSALAEECDLEPESSVPWLVSKVVVARRCAAV